jgi:hypothetical protein
MIPMARDSKIKSILDRMKESSSTRGVFSVSDENVIDWNLRVFVDDGGGVLSGRRISGRGRSRETSTNLRRNSFALTSTFVGILFGAS